MSRSFSMTLNVRIARTLFAVLLAIAVPVCAAVEIAKSPGDQRAFKYLQLDNGMRVLLISDPDTDKAAAALEVAAGSASDPAHRQGLAHFLEHMLFLGTEKYPEAGEYDEFIIAHGGNHNAYTGSESTNYHFEIDRNFLEPALDRFSQFFIAPLFTADYVQREKNAVHSEYKSRITDDDRRLHSVLQQVVNPGHPFAKFAVGNLDTLSDNGSGAIRDELIRFYQAHYSAGLMTLAVLGKEPLPVLENWVTARFAPIENRHLRPPPITVPLFEPGRLPLRVDVEPLREQRQLELYFPIPPILEHYRVKPIDYIANLLGHEGKGSLLSLLKSKGWAEQLAAGLGRDDRDGAAFSLSMRLTETGLTHVDDIVALVFETLMLIERDGVAEWRYREQARLAQIAFDHDQQDSPLGTVVDLAGTLDRVAPEDVLRAHFLMLQYDEALIRSYLGHLRPDNMLTVVMAKGVQVTQRDPWYDAAYAVMPLTVEKITARQPRALDTALQLPPPNPFIPEDTSLKPLEAGAGPIPVRIEEQPGYELWFKQDDTFHQPRADFYFSVRTTKANDTPTHAVLASLYTRLVSEQLNELTYAAQLAGLSYSIYPHIRGFTVRIGGYDDKLQLLLQEITAALLQPHIEAEVLARERAGLIRALENLRHANPYEQTLSEVAKLLVRPGWSESRRIEAARGVTIADVRRFVPEMLGEVQVIALAHGNLHRHDAQALGDILKQALVNPARTATIAPGQVVQLEPGSNYRREIAMDHPDSAVVAYFQGADKTPAERARFDLLAQLLEAPYYNDLRTEKQLGYIVSAGSLPLLEVPGITFVVQSPTTPPDDLESHIEQFIIQYRAAIMAMPAELFENHRTALLSRILDREERLQTRTDRYWNELDGLHYQFDSRARLAAATHAITLEEFRRFYERVLLAPQRRYLLVRSPGTGDITAPSGLPDKPHITIGNPDEFPVGRVFFPDTTPEEVAPVGADPGAKSYPCGSSSTISC